VTRSMNFDVTATDNAAAEFLRIAQAVERLENKLEALDRRKAEPTIQANITPATRSIQQLQTRLDALRNVRAAVVVDGAADARREVTALVVEMRKIRDVRARVELQTGTARADVTAIAERLRALRDARVRVSLDTGTVQRDIARLHQRISALNGTTVRIKVEVDAGNSVAELTAIATLLREVRGTTRHRVDVDTGNATSSVRQLGSALGNLGKAAGAGIAIPGLISTLGQVSSLGASLVQLTGVLGLVPAVGLAAGAAVATFVIGLNGLGDALGPTGTAAEVEKVNEAMARLSPSARALVTEIRALGPAWTGTRLEVQERLLAGVGAEAQRLGGAYLPVLKTGLGGIAAELNSGTRMWSDWAGQAPQVASLNTILGNTRSTLRELAPAGTNVAAALTDVAVVGSGIMPELAAGATAATGRFREFVAEARRTGELEQWIRGGISTLEQLGRIAGNTGGILGSMFSASEEAGYGFLDLVEQLTGELDTLLSSTAGRQALVDVFRESRDAINAMLPGIRELGSATLETVGAFARSDGLERFAGLVSQTASAIAPLVSEIGSLAGDALGNLASGASLAVSALTPLVGGAAAVTDGLGPIPGLALAAVVAFKGLGAAAVVFAAGAARAAAASAAISASFGAAFVPGSAAAAAGLSRLSTVLVGVGRALPLIGVGLVGAGFAIDQFTADFDGAVQRVLSGSQSMQQAIAEQAATVDANEIAWLGGRDAAESYALAQEQVTSRVAEAIGQMGPLEAAQARATLAQTAYNDAVRDFGATSPQAIAAARDLSVATDAVEGAQRSAQLATQSHTDAMRDQVAAAQSALGANLDLAEAARAVAEAEEAANAAIRDSGASSEAAAVAVEQLTRAAMQQADAAKQVAINQAEAAGSTDAAAAGEAAYAASLLNTAATLEGPARAAVLGQIATLSDAELAALSAGAAATGFATQLLTLPDGRTVTIAVDPETGEIVSTQQLLDGMQDADVAVNVETQAALAGLEGFLGIVNGAAGTVTIDGNPQAAGSALVTVLGQIAAGQESVTINGRTVPAEQALGMIVGQISASGAEVTIGGQNFPAGQVLGDTLAAIRAGREEVTIGGNRYPADGVLNALLGSVSGSSAALTILGRDGGVAALKANLSKPSSSTHTINIVTRGSGIREFHAGGIQPRQFHDGGVQPAVALAGGAQIPRRFTAGSAQIFPPRVLRITGDRNDVDEFYIPDNRAPRSMALAGEWARRRGMELVPRAANQPGAAATSGSAGVGAMRDRYRQAMTQARTAPPAMVAPVDIAPMVRELTALRGELRSRTGTTVNQTLVTADPAEAGRQSALAIRTGI
jgi:hypothetical protein